VNPGCRLDLVITGCAPAHATVTYRAASRCGRTLTICRSTTVGQDQRMRDEAGDGTQLRPGMPCGPVPSEHSCRFGPSRRAGGPEPGIQFSGAPARK
jgi:hypothetical protein